MVVCCFFGHHDTPETVKTDLNECVTRLIENNEADSFLVGTHGKFDSMVLSVLRSAKKTYPHIAYSVVLAYMPSTKEEYELYDPAETVYPEGLETVPRRFAISWRNDWMLKQSELVVCYVKHSMGGSGKFVDKAMRQKKRVINLASAERSY